MNPRRLLGRLALGAGEKLPPGVRRAVNSARGIDTPALVDRPVGSSVLVLAPHPDDELIGCGGTVAKHLAGGDQVVVALLSSGERTVGLAALSPEDAGRHREREATRAAEVIGLPVRNLRFLRESDGHVRGSQLAELLAELRPELVYAPHPVDSHRDHRAAATALAAALPNGSVRRVALYEVWTPISANTVVDITDHVEQKLEALACYESALASVDYLHTVRGLAAYRSAQCLRGRGYAEAFTVLSVPAFREMVALVEASSTKA